MTVEELIKTIHSLYIEAHKPFYQHDRIFRGEARPIPSLVEDLFAYFLVDRLPTDANIFINQPLTSGTGSSRIRIKPDIVIEREGEIKAIIDLKMDLGYKRNEFGKSWDERDSLMPKLFEEKFSLYKKKNGQVTHLELTFSKNAKLYYLVISDTNINASQLKGVVERIGEKKHSETYFLFKGIHPNSTKTTLKELLDNLDAISERLNHFLIDLNKLVQ